MEQLLSTLTFIALYGVSYGVVLFTISVGLVVTMGLMGVVNMAHGAFAAIGGYVAVSLMNDLAVPFWMAVPLAVLAVAALSLIVERLFYVHLYTASELDQVLMTIGFAFLVVASLNLAFGPSVLPSRLPQALAANLDLGFRRIQAYRLFIVAFGAILMLVLWFVFDRTSFGARLRAAVDNRSMAQATGIDVNRLFLAAFAIGSGLAALGGALGFAILPLEPLYPFKYLVIVLVVFALAGGDIKASAAVSLLVGVVDTAGRYLFPSLGAFIIYVLLIGLLLWRDRGLVRAQEGVIAAALRSALLERHRIGRGEIVYWLLALAVFWAFPGYLSLATSVLIMALFALSLDLVLGFAGIVTLGHAFFFGIGAYAAGRIALAGHTEAISGALLAGTIAATSAAVLGPLVLRLGGLALIMVTLALGVILYEAANKAGWLTGGDDGLRGIELAPLLGTFPWTVYGNTAYLYALGWLFVLFLFARRLVASPFGVALQGIRENSTRMRLLGAPVLGHLVLVFTVAGFMAGVAGALSAQTTKFVGLEVLSLEMSVDALVIVTLGGVARLYGGLVGAPVYLLFKHFAAQWNPYHWMFVIGALLIGVPRFARGGLLGMIEAGFERLVRRINILPR